MRTVLVASSKGGVGKTTIATNLAAHFALEGKRTVLVDADRQKSSSHWTEKRAGLPSAVLPIDGTRRNWDKLLPPDTQVTVIDAPAGAMGDDLEPYLARGGGLGMGVAEQDEFAHQRTFLSHLSSGAQSSWWLRICSEW